MSGKSIEPRAVIEWSPNSVRAFDPKSGSFRTAETLEGLQSFLGSNREVIVALSRRASFVRAVRMPNAPTKEIGQILAMQIGNHFPIPASDLAWDFHVTNDMTMEGRLVVVAAVQTDLRKRIDDEIKAAGMKAVKVQPLALGSALLARNTGQDSCAVLEETEEGLAIDVVSSGELVYSRVVPMPLSRESADNEICRSFQIAGVSGGAVLATPGVDIEVDDKTTSQGTLEVLAKESGFDLNIELESTKHDRAVKRETQKVRMAMLVIAAAGLMSVGILMDRAEAAATLAKGTAKWQGALRKLRSERSAAEKLATDATKIGKVLNQAFKPAQPLGDVMGKVSNLTPAGVWLNGLTLDRGKPLQIRGVGINNTAVSAYVDALSSDPRFRDVRLIFSNNSKIEDRPVMQFAIQAHVMGNLPLVEVDKRGASKK